MGIELRGKRLVYKEINRGGILYRQGSGGAVRKIVYQFTNS